MYVLQEKPDDEVKLRNGIKYKPVATLKDEYGNAYHIVEEDYRYLLVFKHTEAKYPSIVSGWFPEAVDAMKTLPTPKRA